MGVAKTSPNVMAPAPASNERRDGAMDVTRLLIIALFRISTAEQTTSRLTNEISDSSTLKVFLSDSF